MDFSKIKDITDSGGIKDNQDAIDMFNNRSICYFARGKAISELKTTLSTLTYESDYFIIPEKHGRGCFVFVDSTKHSEIELAIWNNDGTVLEPEWSKIQETKERLENS